MNETIVAKWLIERIRSGNNILYPLNLMLYCDFRKWSINDLDELVKIVNKLVMSKNLDTNIMLISTNPILMLGLMIQYLKKIKDDYNIFDMDCHKLIGKFELLGNIVVNRLPFD